MTVVALGPSSRLVAAHDPPVATVLVVHTMYKGYVPFERLDSRMSSVIRETSTRRVTVQTEFLDVMVARGPEYDRAMLEYIRQKYAGTRVAVVVGVGAQAARFAIQIRAELYPNAALVHSAVDRKFAPLIDFGTNVTGVTGLVDIPGTTSFALQIFPETKRIAIVIGASDGEKAWYERAIAEVRTNAPSVEVIPLFGLEKDETMRRISELPDHTVLIWATYRSDPAGTKFAPQDVLAEARRVSAVPMVGLFEYDLGGGIVGGRLVDLERLGDESGKVIARILNGESADTIVPLDVVDNPIEVDWREVEHWRIDPRTLPSNTIIAFREPTAWDTYKWYIFGGATIIAIQALLILGLVVQRGRRVYAQRALAERNAVERLVADLSARFSDLRDEDIDSAVAQGLASIRSLFDADRTSLVLVGANGQLEVAYSLTALGVEHLSGVLDPEAYPEIVECLRRFEIVCYPNPEESTSSAPQFRAAFEQRGVHATIAVPLHSGGSGIGALSIVATRAAQSWDVDYLPRLRLIADAFANAIVRKRGAAEVRRSSALSEAVLRSMSAQVCVLNSDGQIVAANDAWNRTNDKTETELAHLLLGSNGDGALSPSTSSTEADATKARSGIRAVLDGVRQAFSLEYRVTTSTADAWYLLTVEQLRLPEGGAVLSHQNITSRKRAELESEQRRQELAHVARVSTMGELAASIAHELNQPLTGVLTNAQAAMRFLERTPPNIAEVGEILRDIIEDDRRAGEVIRRLRSMLQTGTIEPAEIDLRDAVAEVNKLLASDATLRSVAIESEVAKNLPHVRGDRIQLQQVILNLIVNAMDAVKDLDASERRVTVRTASADPHTVLVSVSDCGPGIEHDKLGRIFQPFFTTKSQGMGMGLSIARTIIEAHGGVLWATNNANRGASFFFRLPSVPNGRVDQ